jgi:hypothetical protein
MPTPPLGWIEPKDRTPDQNHAHAMAMTRRSAFGLPYAALPKGVKVILTDLWKHPTIVADIGKEFTGFGQHTGSCVGVSAGNAVATLSFVQRLLGTNPTKAFVPWWPFPYGRTRYNEGDRGQGEGAMDSVMGETLRKEGVFDAGQSGLPQYQWDGDGMWLASGSVELKYSDGNASVNTQYLSLAKQHPVGGVATINSVDEIETAIVNGYPVLDGCELYCGNGSIKGSGADAYVSGRYDGRGGHSTCLLGVWNHPNDGRLFLYSNQWPTSTYPKDPAGGGRCTVWLPESEVAKLLSQYGGNNGETMALSHLNWFPAQPDMLDFLF